MTQAPSGDPLARWKGLTSDLHTMPYVINEMMRQRPDCVSTACSDSTSVSPFKPCPLEPKRREKDLPW